MGEKKKPTNKFTRARAKRWFARVFPHAKIRRFDGVDTFHTWSTSDPRLWGGVLFGRFCFTAREARQ